MRQKNISICIQSLNEEKNISLMYHKLKKIIDSFKNYDFEIIFADNCSTDNTREEIIKLAKKDKRAIGIFLSRNFGPEASGHAALYQASGDAIIGFGADMQDPPEVITKLIKKWEEGYDIVLGTYERSEKSLFIALMRKLYYRVSRKMTSIDFPPNTIGFGLFDRKVLNALISLPEKNRFGRGLLSWVGFKRAYIPYKRQERVNGKSSYTFFDYLKHAERGLFGFSYLPLDLMIYSGFILVILSFIFIVGYLYWVIAIGNPIQASIPLMLAIVFFGGITLLAISILGKYIQVIVEETKRRPMYIIEDSINIDKSKLHHG
ncbi:hypothetical protein A3C23_00810 [Candidatus Roizmanbacteria bacterium RIFCSPHIGHO2_02_FULL_37_13b]|uniref:Glycosyltransferase 2-like domain-containing protein n=1 Tax=Candidatus Roizmanbacteria bacterium RIFCSPLOWO2_02_FULL_36_11 TaxID=1802071 RepID=A0A1F7JD56_9BACT|nr:MAG: hypothetical protein A3C23_00810 [Candidatus Roizmanbacteria bacterium RIFCSPHIGHO2_02_FULL_37_13b]OGK53537.1 MAG: hypothetical protein A3H78_04920 [Candidatus Roizmanbacteria bacterium RIFCSPLOWO2_02_FULL_36_11]